MRLEQAAQLQKKLSVSRYECLLLFRHRWLSLFPTIFGLAILLVAILAIGDDLFTMSRFVTMTWTMALLRNRCPSVL